jgi:hypothetical protein
MSNIDTLNDRRNAFAATIRHLTLIMCNTHDNSLHFFYGCLRSTMQVELDKVDNAIHHYNKNN